MSWDLLELRNNDIYTYHAAEDYLLEKADGSGFNSTIILASIKPGISLASNQNYMLDVDALLCERDGIDITRRKTGGRAMYFDENYLMISVITKEHEFLETNSNYDKSLGIIFNIFQSMTGKQFYIAHKNDVMVDGRKIGGAAQRNSPNFNLVHMYLRVGDDLDKMLDYIKIDGQGLKQYYNELKDMLTSMSQLGYDKTRFYQDFKNKLLDVYKPNSMSIHPTELQDLLEKYHDRNHIVGRADFPSKGHCDIIEGSNNDARLKIKSLEGKVKFI